MTKFQLLLVEADPIFRLGFKAACEVFPDLQIVAEVATGAEALQILEEFAKNAESSGEIKVKKVDLAIVDAEVLPSLDRTNATEPNFMVLCQQLKTEYPDLPILLLGRSPMLLTVAQEAGVNGYCLKGTEIAVVVQAIRLVASGQTYWEGVWNQEIEVNQGEILNPQFSLRDRFFSPFARLCRSGIRQIDTTLVQVTAELEEAKVVQAENFSSLLDWVVLSGRRRELLAARWFVSQMLPAKVTLEKPKQQDLGRTSRAESLSLPRNSGSENAIIPYPLPTGNSQFNLQAALFDATAVKLQSGLVNLSGVPLEIDILRVSKKRELIYVILRKIEALLDELRFSQVQLEQLPEKRSTLVRDLWEGAIADFFGKYYTLQSKNKRVSEGSQRSDGFILPPSTWVLSGNGVEVVPVLLQEGDRVQKAILDKIPLVVDFLAHLLFQTPLKIDNISSEVGSPEAMQRSEALLQNLAIQVANGVVQPLLNHFADIEEIKNNFYDRRLISTRDVERFRNNLSWKYRLESSVWEPKAIFESRFWLLVMHERGIHRVSIYSPRNPELAELSGVQLAVTLVLETRDAIAPRLQAIISFMGTGVVYILTQIIGRGIGLIGRGILQGVGNSLQERKLDKKGDRQN